MAKASHFLTFSSKLKSRKKVRTTIKLMIRVSFYWPKNYKKIDLKIQKNWFYWPNKI